MVLDPARLLDAPPIITRQTLTRRDTILYALGVGATELDYVYEEQLKALPTMAVVLGYPGFIWRNPAYGVDWAKVLHGEQSIELHTPIPIEGEIVGETVIEALFDKGVGKGAIARVRRDIRCDGVRIATSTASIFLRADGGFGGSAAGAPVPRSLPTDRAPDHVVCLPTAPDQALLYRLSGDYNPLHIDPAVAKAGGFDRPILHGLCTYGVAGRALVAALPGTLARVDARFSAPVYPGETIVTEIWQHGAGRAAFRAHVAERDLVVLTNGYAEFT